MLFRSVAVWSGPEGLEAYRQIVGGAADWLRPGGWLMVEIGSGQAGTVSALLRDSGLVDVEVARYLVGRDRIVTGRRPS